MGRAHATMAFAVLVAMIGPGCSGILEDGPASPGHGRPSSPPPTTPPDIGGGPLTSARIPVSGARRLSRTELDNTLELLLGRPSELARTLLPEDDASRPGLFLNWPFDNAYPRQESDRIYVEAFEAIASEAARRTVADESALAALLPCTPTGPDDSACMRAFVTELGGRALRRPLVTEEIDALASLGALAIEANDFMYGVECVLRALLQLPDFVHRIEIGTADPELAGVARLTDHEIAARMSYFLWGTAPDRGLTRLADEGALTSAARRREIARDMLEDPRAEAQVDRFHAMWLGYSALPHSAELTAAMRAETRALLRRVIFEERRPYLDLFTFAETRVAADLAERYGLPAPAPDAGPMWISYGSSGRAGILSHGSVLSAFAKVDDTSPTKRGIFVRERLLCEILLPPPPTVNVDDVPEVECRSDLVAAHQTGACASCHALMDPIGWGLERFDRTGRYRTHDDGNASCPIEGDGELLGIGTFEGPGELAALLVESGRLEACVVRQVVRFAIGREEREEDEAFIEALVRSRAGTDWQLLDLLVDIAASEELARTRPDPIVGGRTLGE